MKDWPRRPVDSNRLAFCDWSSGTCRGEGDIHASYSADRIAEGKPIRKPFEFDGSLWVCVSAAGKELTGSGDHELKAYRLMPPQVFKGESTTYAGRCNVNDGDDARNDPMGFYNGVRISCGCQAYILNGPPEVFIAGTEPERPARISKPEAGQLSLF